jgi:ABC-type lipoprotein release transport system permease subunit
MIADILGGLALVLLVEALFSPIACIIAAWRCANVDRAETPVRHETEDRST